MTRDSRPKPVRAETVQLAPFTRARAAESGIAMLIDTTLLSVSLHRLSQDHASYMERLARALNQSPPEEGKPV